MSKRGTASPCSPTCIDPMPVAVPIGADVEYRIPLVANARRFDAGHRIRLFLTSDDQDPDTPAIMNFRHASVGTSSPNTVASTSPAVVAGTRLGLDRRVDHRGWNPASRRRHPHCATSWKRCRPSERSTGSSKDTQNSEKWASGDKSRTPALLIGSIVWLVRRYIYRSTVGSGRKLSR